MGKGYILLPKEQASDTAVAFYIILLLGRKKRPPVNTIFLSSPPQSQILTFYTSSHKIHSHLQGRHSKSFNQPKHQPWRPWTYLYQIQTAPLDLNTNFYFELSRQIIFSTCTQHKMVQKRQDKQINTLIWRWKKMENTEHSLVHRSSEIPLGKQEGIGDRENEVSLIRSLGLTPQRIFSSATGSNLFLPFSFCSLTTSE